MRRLRSVIIGYAIVTLFCVGQPVPESRAANRVLSQSVTTPANSAAIASPATESISLAKADKIEDAGGENEIWTHVRSTVIPSRYKTSKVEIRGNSVLVPITLVYGRNKVNVHLLLDTGSSGTAIHTEIANRLSINLSKAIKTKVQVVGGAVIEADVIRINSLMVGPHTIRDWNIFVIPHKGSAVKADGLLGMDVLQGLNYKVDFKKQIIIWNRRPLKLLGSSVVSQA